MEVLDRNSYTPLYHQIAEALRARIESGELVPGDQIPSENELTEQYAVSRNTVRLAISSLILDGLVYRVKGRGTFVAAERLHYGLMRLGSFTEEMNQRGSVPSSRILSVNREKPSKKIQQILQLESSQMVYRLERLRLANEEPIAINLSFLPASLCPDIDKKITVADSLYALLENQFGYQLGYAEYVIKISTADERQAELLDVAVDSSLLTREGTTYLENGLPIEHTLLFIRGDRYEFTFRVAR